MIEWIGGNVVPWIANNPWWTVFDIALTVFLIMLGVSYFDRRNWKDYLPKDGQDDGV